MNTTNFKPEAALAAWATKDLPGRLLASEAATLLHCTPEDVTILASAGKLHPLGRPKPNAVKYFSTVELIGLLANREWLDDATKTIAQHWRRKNARRHGAHPEAAEAAEKPSTKPSTISSTDELETGICRVKSGSERVEEKAA